MKFRETTVDASPMSRDNADILPREESIVDFRKLDNGEWLVTETKITRTVRAEGPKFTVVK